MDLQYPIGKFQWDGIVTNERRKSDIDSIAALPAQLRAAVEDLNPEQLATPYRPGGWTVRQVIHHVPDSHMNAYIRTKLALTEDEPVIKPYEEDLWAELHDTAAEPIEVSLALLENLHSRWVTLLRSLSIAQAARKFRHPALGPMDLNHQVALYAWHGAHHLAHITSLMQRMEWKSAAPQKN
jgi:uncharacterized damage-inducible protein DinB